MVRTLPPAEIAELTGRSLGSVYQRRFELGVTKRRESKAQQVFGSLPWLIPDQHEARVAENPVRTVQPPTELCGPCGTPAVTAKKLPGSDGGSDEVLPGEDLRDLLPNVHRRRLSPGPTLDVAAADIPRCRQSAGFAKDAATDSARQNPAVQGLQPGGETAAWPGRSTAPAIRLCEHGRFLNFLWFQFPTRRIVRSPVVGPNGCRRIFDCGPLGLLGEGEALCELAGTDDERADRTGDERVHAGQAMPVASRVKRADVVAGPGRRRPSEGVAGRSHLASP
jgi:hypothetical protein